MGLLASHASSSADRCNLKSHLASNEDKSGLQGRDGSTPQGCPSVNFAPLSMTLLLGRRRISTNLSSLARSQSPPAVAQRDHARVPFVHAREISSHRLRLQAIQKLIRRGLATSFWISIRDPATPHQSESSRS